METKTRIIIFQEKHGSRVLPAWDDEQLGKSCLKIITERFHEAWYGTEGQLKSDTNELEVKKLSLDELVNSGPVPQPLQQSREFEIGRLKRSINHLSIRINEFNMVKKIVETKDYKSAYKFIDRRGCGEYEKYEIMTVEDNNV